MEEREIKHTVKTAKVANEPRRTFHIYDNGETCRTFEIVEKTDPSSGKKSKDEVWRERQELVRFPARVLKNQDYEAARQMWKEKFKMHEEKIRDGTSHCQVCDGAIAIWRHTFDNDDEQVRDTHLYKMCADCGRMERIHKSEKKVAYEDLPPEPAGEKEE